LAGCANIMSLLRRRWKLLRNPSGRQVTTAMAIELPRIREEHGYSKESPRVAYADGGRYLRVSFKRTKADEWNDTVFGRRPVRGQCKGFSFGSRRRFLDRTNQISCAAELPAFVTMTFPDDCYKPTVADFAKDAKACLDVLVKRFRRACPSACGFWRIEWQTRKSGLHEGKLFPHFHLLVWGLGQRSLGKNPEDGSDYLQSFVPVIEPQQDFVCLCNEVLRTRVFKSAGRAKRFAGIAMDAESRAEGVWSAPVNNFMSAADWFALNWYHVVGTGNLDHFMAGCRVEQIRGWGGVLSYCAKYMTKADADAWMPDARYGRSWGIFNRAAMPWAKMIEFPLDAEVGVRLRRIARRYLEHQTGRKIQRHYGMTIYCDARNFARLIPAPPPDCPY